MSDIELFIAGMLAGVLTFVAGILFYKIIVKGDVA